MIKQLVILAVLFLSLIHTGRAVRGVTVYSEISNFKCFRDLGFQFFMIDSFHQDHTVDSAYNNILNASKMGVPVDIIMTPCQLQSPETQVRTIINSLPMVKVKIAWINITAVNSAKCAWLEYDYSTNCGFLTGLHLAFDKQGVRTGIYSTQQDWIKIFGSASGCSKFSSVPLWYKGTSSLDFTDWPAASFGNWTNPYAKMYTQTPVSICLSTVDTNYAPVHP